MVSKKAKLSRKPAQEAAEASSSAGFSLFSGVKDSALDDVFSKGAALAIAPPVPLIPVAPMSLSVGASAPTPTATPKSLKKGKGKDKNSGKGKPAAPVQVEVQDDEEDDEAEEAVKDAEVEDEDEDEVEDDGELVHESLKSPASRKAKDRSVAKKYTPLDETSVDRDRRTVFIGNLPVEVAKSKSALSQLRTHILSFVPTAKIESVRFRSVAFAAPTAYTPSDDPEKDETRRLQRERERAAAWKAEQEKAGASGKKRGRRDDEEENVDTSKIFLDSKGKRKVAFIKKDFHAEMSSCNAYIVFEHPHPDRPANVRPILNPYEAASTVISQANGSTFLSRTLRVDALRLPSAAAFEAAAASSSSPMTALARRDAWLPSGTDPKKSLFVGGLDYASKDEDVREFFEQLVKAERGEAPSAEGGKWVTSVRIVRDKETQMGKGFGYVHFIDRESVDEVIALNSSKLKLAKRPLRVQPCKTLPTFTPTKPTPSNAKPTTSTSTSASTSSKSKSAAPKPKPAAVPKGDPSLGEKIRALSKDERKAVKSSDADRLARRLAKKKAKVTLAHAGDKGKAVSLAASKADKERTRKKVVAKKGRKRSENAVSKMKGQRSG